MRTIILTIILSFCAAASMAQNRYLAFNNLDGVSRHLCVRDITQSDDGMIWMAAENGLYCYDGYHLMEMKNNINKPLGSFNTIENCTDSLLIGCNVGVLSFNLATHRFALLPYAAKETVVGIRRAGADLWVASSSTLYCNGRALALGLSNIISLESDSNNLYIGTHESGMIYSLKKKTLEAFVGNVPFVTSFFRNANGDMWVGTAVSVINGEYSLPMPVVKCIGKMAGKDDAPLLVGTDNGLYVIDSLDAHRVSHDARMTNSLAGDAVWCIFHDRDDNVWLGTNSGVSVMTNSKTLTSHPLPSITGEGAGNQLSCVFQDNSERLWLGGSNGLICIEHLGEKSQTHRWYRMGDATYPISHNRIRSIAQDLFGRIWVGGDMGLALYDEETKQFERYLIDNDPNNWTYDITAGDKGRLTVTTFTATYIVQPRLNDKKLEVVSTMQKQEKTHKAVLELQKYKLQDSFLSAFLLPNSDKILLGGYDVFALLDTKEYEKRSVSAKPVITAVKIEGKEFASYSEIVSKSITLDCGTKYIEVLFSDFNYTGELPVRFHYSLDGKPWTPTGASIMLSSLDYGSHTLTISSEGDESCAAVLNIHVKAPWYATIWAKILYAIIVLALIYGIYRFVRLRRALRERDAMLASARTKEQSLLEKNEYLTAQLKIRLQGDSDDEDNLTEDEKLLLAVTKIIEDNLSNSDLDVEMLAKMSGVSSKQLYRKIKATTGMTTVAYIRDQRMKKAASLLSKGAFTVSEVMYAVGFSNPSYFTRCFSEVYSMSPSEFKETKGKGFCD